MRRRGSGIGTAWLALMAVAGSGEARAGHPFIDKIYHPYVQPLEKAFELRSTVQSGNPDSPGRLGSWLLGYGRSVGERWWLEGYLAGTSSANDAFDITEVELEGVWQITEQGEYVVDTGLLLEFGQSADDGETELSAALLLEKELGRWSATANLYTLFKTGGSTQDSLEGALSLQGRYRLSRTFEPAIEYYRNAQVNGLGPVFMGTWPLGPGHALYWEAGLIFGLDRDTPDRNFKLLIEYEF